MEEKLLLVVAETLKRRKNFSRFESGVEVTLFGIFLKAFKHKLTASSASSALAAKNNGTKPKSFNFPNTPRNGITKWAFPSVSVAPSIPIKPGSDSRNKAKLNKSDKSKTGEGERERKSESRARKTLPPLRFSSDRRSAFNYFPLDANLSRSRSVDRNENKWKSFPPFFPFHLLMKICSFSRFSPATQMGGEENDIKYTEERPEGRKSSFVQKLIITRAWEISLMRSSPGSPDVCVCEHVAIFTPFSYSQLPRNTKTIFSLFFSFCFLCNFRQSSFKDFSSRRLFFTHDELRKKMK